MGEDKERNIKNRTYYYFDVMIDIINFHSNLLKIDNDRGSHIYYINYLTIKKFSNFNCNCNFDCNCN